MSREPRTGWVKLPPKPQGPAVEARGLEFPTPGPRSRRSTASSTAG
jgi:hypothetical protein